MSLVRALHDAKWLCLSTGLSIAMIGCSSLGSFDYGDGEADRFTAGDDEPYVPNPGDGDDGDDASSSAPVTGPSGTGVDPSSSDDGAATDLRPDDSATGSSDDTSGGDEAGSIDDTSSSSSSSEGGDTMDPGGSDTSGTSGPDDPANLPQRETSTSGSSTDDGTPA